MKPGWWMGSLYWAAVAVLMVPIGLIALTSLTDTTLVGFPLGKFSLRWYAAALSDPATGRALLLSLGLAAASSILAIVIGAWIALAAQMLRSRWRWVLLTATLVPLVTPGIVHAIALRMAIQFVGVGPGSLAVLLGHVIHATPLVVIMVSARLATTPRGLMEAARDLGAGPICAFVHVQLAWLWPALGGAGLLVALNSFDDFVRSFFLGGYDQTLPVLIFGRLRSGLTPEINAVATLTLLSVLALGLAACWLGRPSRPSQPIRLSP
jgi:spermidine/putrescine transport system permease protein